MSRDRTNSFRQPDRALALRLLCLTLALLFIVSHASAQTAPPAGSTTGKQPPENQQTSKTKAVANAARTGSITGRVLSDDGHPVANATIFAFGLGINGTPTGGTVEADGKFQINELRPGAYIVQVAAPGYVVVPDAGAELGVPRYYHVGENVNLTMLKGGVITGTVTDSNGEPVIAAVVRAIRVRKPLERQAPAVFNFGMPRMTDDRGVYRMYGLEPGAYVIAIGGSAQTFGNINAYDADSPTYYPSATRDTAAELTVHAGEELTGIDVRYRGERGRIISGSVTGGPTESNNRFSGVSVSLIRTASGSPESFTFTGEENSSFALNGVGDGDYTLMATRGLGNSGEALTALRKVSVRGADVTGVELKLEARGSLTGNVILDAPPKPDCTNQRGSMVEEIVITSRANEKEKPEESVLPFWFRRITTAPNDKGEFRLFNLRSGSNRLDIKLPGDDWYVRSIVMPAATPTNAKTPAAAAQSKTIQPGAFTLKQGERISGVSITIGQGAAGLRGRVARAAEGMELPARLRLHLVPVEPERAGDVLRYMEAEVERDGAFALSNIAPGRYWLVARADNFNEIEGAERRAVALDAPEREKLRREAESAGVKIDLLSCQRLADYVLNYGATPSKQPGAK